MTIAKHYNVFMVQKICSIFGDVIFNQKLIKTIRLVIIDLVVEYNVHDFIFLENNYFQNIVYNELQILKDKIGLNVERFSVYNSRNNKEFLKESQFALCSLHSLKNIQISKLKEYKQLCIINLDNYL